MLKTNKKSEGAVASYAKKAEAFWHPKKLSSFWVAGNFISEHAEKLLFFEHLLLDRIIHLKLEDGDSSLCLKAEVSSPYM